MGAGPQIQKPALRLVEGPSESLVEWVWFCGHCAVQAPGSGPPAPTARVCTSCGLGLFIETRIDAMPQPRDAFLVVDRMLLVQALFLQPKLTTEAAAAKGSGTPEVLNVK